MKKLIGCLGSIILLILGVTSPAQAADTRYFQYSPNDAKNAGGSMNPMFDITSFQQGIDTDGQFEYFILTKSPIDQAEIYDPVEFVVSLDVDLDKSADYKLSSYGIEYGDDSSPLTVRDGFSTDLEDCEAWTWVTDSGNAVGFQVPLSCIENLGSYINVQVSVTDDNQHQDQLPEGNTWLKLKTSWFAGQVCNSSKNKTKKTYMGVTYICVSKSGKYSFQPYANYASSMATYYTEKAYYSCNLGGTYGVSLADGGRTLTIDSGYKYGVNESQFNCIAKWVAMPSSVRAHIGMTRALDGIQRDSWSHMSAFWNYHPDSGLDITFTYK